MCGKPVRCFGRVLSGLMVTAVAAFVVAPAAMAEPMLHARISHESGGALVRGSEDADWSYATVNTIILPGDTLWIDQQGTLEVEMSGGSFLRMADKTKVELEQLSQSITANAWTGSLYVQRVSRSTGDFKVRTPAATVNIERDSQVRIDVVGEGSTTVSVRWGRVSIATDAGAPVVAGEGQRVYIDPGLLPSNPIFFDKTLEDDFDAWNRERARLLALGDRALPATVRVEQSAPVGYSDLASYGEWVYVDDRQYWRPTVVVDYVPYRDGYWSYVPAYGYSWTGAYPFCYVTSHYGRWNYYPAHGWLWCYDPVWSPAWCATAYYGNQFVWCPLDYYNRPCSYGSTFYVGGIPFSISFSSYCRPYDLYYGPCAVYPCYNDLFVNVHVGDVYIWNIFADGYNHHNPWYGSSALVRNYNPRRVIRGLEHDGVGNVAASHRARALTNELGRSDFASSRSSTARSVRTSQTSGARQARLRDTSLGAGTDLDTGAAIQRARHKLEVLRGSDDNRPHAQEARRERMAALERSAENARNSKLPGSSARSVRGDAVDTIRGRRDNAGTDRAKLPSDRSGSSASASLRDRITPRAERQLEQNDQSSVARNTDLQSPIDRLAPRAERRTEQDALRRTVDPGARTDIGAGEGRGTGRRTEIAPDPASRMQPPGRTLDSTRTRDNEPDTRGRTQLPDHARIQQQPNVPRISGGDGRNERSQSLGTLPQVPQRSRTAINDPVRTYTPEPSSRVPQSRVIPDTSRGRQDYTPRIERSPAPVPAPSYDPPRNRVEAPRFEPQSRSMPAPQYNAPRVEAQPRIEMPQPRFEPQARQMQAPPQPRIEAPRIEAPRIEPQARQMRVPDMPSRPSFDAGAPRGGGGGGGRGDGGGRGRR